MGNDKLTLRQASDLLGIGTETLKKYAALLEHISVEMLGNIGIIPVRISIYCAQ